jgi:hypothetical protein
MGLESASPFLLICLNNVNAYSQRSLYEGGKIKVGF